MVTFYDDDGRPTTLYSQTDIARAIGLSPKTVWGKVRRLKTFPAPEVRRGRRDYYSEPKFKKLVKAFTKKR